MAYLNSPRRTPKVCPVCGEDVPPKALACPECGADHNTGWRPGALQEDALDLPDEDEDDFDYEEFLENEFGTPRSVRPRHLHPVWWIAAILTLMAFILMMALAH